MLSSLVGAIFPISSGGMTWRRFDQRSRTACICEVCRLRGSPDHFLLNVGGDGVGKKDHAPSLDTLRRYA